MPCGTTGTTIVKPARFKQPTRNGFETAPLATLANAMRSTGDRRRVRWHLHEIA